MNELYTQLLQTLQAWSRTPLSHSSLPAIDNQPALAQQLQACCQQLLQEGSRHQHAEWAAHMTAPVSVPSLAGQLLAALHHGNLLSAEIYPLLEQIEKQLLQWFCERFSQQHGHFTHGSTYANLEALWHAREHAPSGRHKVYGSQAVHYSIIKACQLLGLEFQSIHTDSCDRMLPEALQQACDEEAPVAVIINAGTTGCGSFDPIDQLIPIIKTCHAWCHVDAAWGGFLALLPEYQALFQQLKQVNSICFDPHKGLSQPRPCGLLMYQQTLKPLDADTSYLNRTVEQRLPGSYGGELFLPLWLDIQTQGLQQIQQQLRVRIQQAQHFADLLQQQRLWYLHSETGIVCFKLPQQTQPFSLDHGIVSTTNLHGEIVYRAVFASASSSAEAVFNALVPYV